MNRQRALPAARPLAVAGYAGVLAFLALGLAVAVFPGVRAFVDAHEGAVTTALVLVLADLFAVWVMAILLLARDRDLPDRQRTTWILLLALLCIYAGPAYVLWRGDRHAERPA